MPSHGKGATNSPSNEPEIDPLACYLDTGSPIEAGMEPRGVLGDQDLGYTDDELESMINEGTGRKVRAAAPACAKPVCGNLYEIRHFQERPYFAIPHKDPVHSLSYVSPDGSIHIDVTAAAGTLGVATVDDAEFFMYICTELYPYLLRDPSCRELSFKSLDMLRRIGRKAGGNQYAALRNALVKLSTTRITTNMSPTGRPGETVTFSFLETWKVGEKRTIEVRVSDWIAEALFNKATLPIPDEYFKLSRGLERTLWRIVRKYVGSQSSTLPMSLDTIYKKMGSKSRASSFNYAMKEIVDRNPYSDYFMTWIDDPVRKRHKIQMMVRLMPNDRL